MKLTLVVALILLVAGMLFVPAPAVCQSRSGCGMKPMKPMVPMGCRDLEAECRCDSRGSNCRWQWRCVK